MVKFIQKQLIQMVKLQLKPLIQQFLDTLLDIIVVQQYSHVMLQDKAIFLFIELVTLINLLMIG